MLQLYFIVLLYTMNEPFEMINENHNIVPNNSFVVKMPTQEDETSLNKQKIKNEIYNSVIYDYIKNEIDENMKGEKTFKKIALCLTILKYVCLVAVPILSLSSPSFKNHQDNLAYASGFLSSIALGFEILQKLCEKISDAKRNKFNLLLEQINIKSFKMQDEELKNTNIN